MAEQHKSAGGAVGDRHLLDHSMAEIAAETRGPLPIYPRPGDAIRRIVLRETRDADESPGVSRVFGTAITAYDWVYVITPEKVPVLLAALGGSPGDDVLALLTDLYRRERGRVHSLLTSAAVGAVFSNWHS